MSPSRKAIGHSALAFLSLWASICLTAGCGPKPGTPEHVLQQLEEGHVVGAEKLQLLTAEHLEPMLAIVDNPDVDRIAKQQIIIRVTSLKLDQPLERIGAYLSHPEPDIRLHMARWMASLNDPQVIDRLIEQQLKESEEIIRIKIAESLATAQCRSQVDHNQVATRLIEHLRAAPLGRKKGFLLALGGYPTDDALKIIGKHLQHENSAIAGSAGRAVVIASQQQINAVADLLPAMVGHSHSDVRRNGLRILWSQVRRDDADACRAELPDGLASRAEQITAALDALKSNTAIHDSEKKLADQILACLKSPAPAQPGQSL